MRYYLGVDIGTYESKGVIVTAANQVLISSGLRDRIDQRGPPTDAP